MARFALRGKRAAKISPGLKNSKVQWQEHKHKRDAKGQFADMPGVGNDAPKKGPQGKSTFEQLASLAPPKGNAAQMHAAASAPPAKPLKLPGSFKAGQVGKTTGIVGTDKIRVVTKSLRFKDGMTIDDYAAQVGGDYDKALRRIAREMKEGKIKIEDAKVVPIKPAAVVQSAQDAKDAVNATPPPPEPQTQTQNDYYAKLAKANAEMKAAQDHELAVKQELPKEFQDGMQDHWNSANWYALELAYQKKHGIYSTDDEIPMLADMASVKAYSAKWKADVAKAMEIAESMGPIPSNALPSYSMSQMQAQKGSNPGGVYQDDYTGKEHYVKFYANPEQGKSEALAGKVFEAMGAKTTAPSVGLVNGKEALITDWNPNLKQLGKGTMNEAGLLDLAKYDPKSQRELADMYHAAVLTKNWDVVGLEFDNIVLDTKTGRLVMVDGGGSFKFRAQGGAKPFGPDIAEADSLLDQKFPAGQILAAARAFNPKAFEDSLGSLAVMNMTKMKETFKNSGLKDADELFENFAARRKALLDKGGFPDMSQASVTTGGKIMTGTSVSTHPATAGMPTPLAKDLSMSTKLIPAMQHNSYPHGTPEWKAYSQVSKHFLGLNQQQIGQSQYGTVDNYLNFGNSKATKTEKLASLQKLIDDGSVILASPVRGELLKKIKDAHVDLQIKQSAKELESKNALLPKLDPVEEERWKVHAGGLKDLSANIMSNPKDKVAAKKALDDAGIETVLSKNNSAVRSYTGTGHSSLNKTLRTPGATLSANQASIVKKLDAMSKTSVFKKDTILYRGVGNDYESAGSGVKARRDADGFVINAMPPPPNFMDRGFGSASFSPAVALNFAGHAEPEKPSAHKTLFRVRVPKGFKATFVARGERDQLQALSDEAEVIIPRNARYKVVSRAKESVTSYGATYVVNVVDVELLKENGESYPVTKF